MIAKIKRIKIEWRSDELMAKVEEAVGKVLTEAGLTAEGKAKQKLRPSLQIADRFVKGGGRGVRTATLRRSIHIATPGYIWGGDDVPPSSTSPERGGKKAEPKREGKKVTLELGSGVNYSIYVHELHYDPEVHHFLLTSVEETKDDLPGIIARHRI